MMNANLKTAIAYTCANYLDNMLVKQQELVSLRKSSGNRVYSLDEYNKEIKALFSRNGSYVDSVGVVRKYKEELVSNILFTDKEIEELVDSFRQGILKYGLVYECSNRNILSLVRKIFDKDMECNLKENLEYLEYDTISSKWSKLLELEKNLGINKEFWLYYSYDRYFSIQDKYRNYICVLDEMGKCVSIRDNGFDTYFYDKLFLLQYFSGEVDVGYLEHDDLISVFRKEKVNISEVNVINFNEYLNEIGFFIKEVYDDRELLKYLSLIKGYLMSKESVDILANFIVLYFDTNIFDNLNEERYLSLLPVYNFDQRKRFKELMIRIVKMDIVDKEEVEFNLVNDGNNKILKLLNDLLIIPRMNILNKSLNVNVSKNMIIETDRLTMDKKIIYPDGIKKNVLRK